MFNIVNSVRPVAVLEAPAFFKGNTCQVAVAATATLTEKDVPLMAAILSPLESNQQRTITEVFRGYQDLSAEELRLKAQQRIRQRAEARSGIPDLDVDEFVHKIGGITGKHKFTREEMDEIRQRVDLLYQNYVTDKQEAQEKEQALFFEAARTARDITGEPASDKFKPMPKEEWADEHGLRRNLKQRKPGPPKKKKKAIWDMEPGEKGLASAPGEAPHFDIQQAEEQWLQNKMQEHIEMLEEESKFLKGKRYRPDELPTQKPADQQNFWI